MAIGNILLRGRIGLLIAAIVVAHIVPAPAQQVARETGAKYGGVLYVDSLSDARGAVPTCWWACWPC